MTSSRQWAARGATLGMCLIPACVPSTGGEPLDAIKGALPALREHALPGLDPTSIPGLPTRLAVSATGALAYVAAEEPGIEKRIRMTDSTGQVVARVGRRGRGPGELQTPLFLAFRADGQVLVWDIATGRLTSYASTGDFASVGDSDADRFPLALVGDSLDFRALQHRGTGLRRMDLVSLRSRELLRTVDSAFDALFPLGTVGGISARPPAIYAAGRGRIALGDMRRYQVLLYTDLGRFIGSVGASRAPQLPSPEEAARESVAIATMPVSPARKATLLRDFRSRARLHFRALRFDATGRLWVIGQDGDSAYADVYADTLPLGRIPIGCPGFTGEGWDLSGRWLALSCRHTAPDAPSDGTIRLFRIEG